VPEVDVICPVWRGREWVSATLQTLREQTFKNWRLIVIDDACPERTGDLVKRLQPSALQIELESNVGGAAARSVGIASSDSMFIALLDQDDLWHPMKLEAQVAALREAPRVGAVHTDAILIDGEGRGAWPRRYQRAAKAELGDGISIRTHSRAVHRKSVPHQPRNDSPRGVD